MHFWTTLPIWLAALWLLRLGLLRLAERLGHADLLPAALLSAGLALLICPLSAQAWTRLGNLLGDAGYWSWAAACFKLATRLRPDWIEAWLGTGISVLVLWADKPLAHQAFLKAYQLRRGQPLNLAGTTTDVFSPVGLLEEPEPAKLLHDAAQLERLVSLKYLEADWLNVAQIYRHWRSGDPAPAEYQRAIYLPQPEFEGSPLAAVDAASVEAEFRSSGNLLSWYDGFLKPEALALLEEFCLNATIWHHVYRNGYLGAHLDDGMSCPLLYQISEALKSTFPEIFKDLQLVYLWAFKCAEDAAGVALHHDSALINVNFWLTPDKANLKPGSGGIVVYPKEPPSSWDLERYRISQADMKHFVKDVEPVRVPYAQNRVVIFNSRLFHASDSFCFAPGYDNQRINVTLLFGRSPLRYHQKQELKRIQDKL